jgi:aldehyde:ferredoxin oxidoreductase
MKEYKCKALYVDLTTGKSHTEEIADEFIKQFLGGYGLNARLGYELIEPKADPLSEKNPIIIGTCPMTGTAVPGSAKTSLLTKFPLTGAFSTGINGSRFGLLLKSSGYSNLIITGKANSPVYLKIHDENVEIRDATSIWGKDINETTDDLWKRHGSSNSVLAIGEAGENKVAISLALVDKIHTWGKGGLGAVMGSKNLKAIVVDGSKGVEVFDPKGLLKIIKDLFDKIVKDPNHEKLIYWGKMGYFQARGHELGWGYENSRSNCPHEIVDLYGANAYEQKYKKFRACCPSCPAGCKDILELKEASSAAGREVYFSSLSGRLNNWASRCNLGSYRNVLECHDFANRNGICVQSFTGLFDLSVELYQKGIITKADTDGIELKRDFLTALMLLKQTARNEGFGAILADGYLPLIRRFGSKCEEVAIHEKGADIQADPRLYRLNTAEFYTVVNPRGSPPTKGITESYVMKQVPFALFRKWAKRTGMRQTDIDRIFYSDDRYHISRLAKHAEDWAVLRDSLGVPCMEPRINYSYDFEQLRELLFCATGIEMPPEGLKTVGERGVNMEKVLNAMEGFGRKDDCFPERWFEPILFDGEEKHTLTYFGDPFTKEVAYKLLDDYYDERGWDIALGIPTLSTLKRLNLSDIAEDLERSGILR